MAAERSVSGGTRGDPGEGDGGGDGGGEGVGDAAVKTRWGRGRPGEPGEGDAGAPSVVSAMAAACCEGGGGWRGGACGEPGEGDVGGDGGGDGGGDEAAKTRWGGGRRGEPAAKATRVVERAEEKSQV